MKFLLNGDWVMDDVTPNGFVVVVELKTDVVTGAVDVVMLNG